MSLLYISSRDRLTTPTNVWACCVCCAVVEHLSRDQLGPIDNLSECTSDTCTADVASNTNSVAIDIAEEENMEEKEEIENIA